MSQPRTREHQSTNQEKASATSSKIIMTLIGIIMTIGGWFGNICYTKLTNIEQDTKLILIANASQKTELDDLKEQFKNHLEHHPGPSPENSGSKHQTFYTPPPTRDNDPDPKRTGLTLLTEFILPQRNGEDNSEHEGS